MSEKIIKIPKISLNVQAIEFMTNLWFLSNYKRYIFDFENVGRIEPFSLLFLGSELKRFRDSRNDSEFIAKNMHNMQHAANMGFFKSFGVDYGESPKTSRTTETYIPIKIMNCVELKKSARAIEKPVGEYLTNRAMSMSNMLTQSSTGYLFETLTYSIREILRNAVEHSGAAQIGFCAEYWPENNKVSLALIDRGIGLKQSLMENPHLNIKNDDDALKLSIQPGISGKAFEGAEKKNIFEWENSGYGLYMTSNICKLGGSFVIASGSSGLYLSKKREMLFPIQFKGTILNLSLNTSKLDSLNNMLAKLRNSEEVKNAPRSPSTESLGLK